MGLRTVPSCFMRQNQGKKKVTNDLLISIKGVGAYVNVWNSLRFRKRQAHEKSIGNTEW